jgi:DNA-binding MarR family transcriptional regulator
MDIKQMMTVDKLSKQIETVNNAFHKIWFAVMFNRPDYKSEKIKKLSFIEMHLIGMAYDYPDMILKEIREYLRIPQTTLSSIIAKLENQGILRRVINHRDMRSFSLEITELGRKIRDTHKEYDYKQTKELILALDENERDEFIRLFQKVANKLSQITILSK